MYHSTLGLRVIKKKKKKVEYEVFVPPEIRGNVTEFAPHKAPKLIA